MSSANIALESWSLNIDGLRSADIEECKSILESIDRVEDRSFIWRGIVLREIERRELWKDDKDALYTSMNDWIHRAPGKSARDRYAALAAVEALKEIPLQDLSQIPRCNVETLQKMSSSVRVQPEVLEAAKGSEDAFVAHVQAHHPDQHIQKRVKPTLRLTPPVQDALDAYAAAYPEVTDRQGQLEGALIDWMQERNDS